MIFNSEEVFTLLADAVFIKTASYQEQARTPVLKLDSHPVTHAKGKGLLYERMCC